MKKAVPEKREGTNIKRYEIQKVFHLKDGKTNSVCHSWSFKRVTELTLRCKQSF